jgi:hypothetical protein
MVGGIPIITQLLLKDRKIQLLLLNATELDHTISKLLLCILTKITCVVWYTLKKKQIDKTHMIVCEHLQSTLRYISTYRTCRSPWPTGTA